MCDVKIAATMINWVNDVSKLNRDKNVSVEISHVVVVMMMVIFWHVSDQNF